MEKLFKDLVIIGAGPGGYELASKASGEGIDVCLIEKEKLGGTCLNCGCIPTKAYFQYAKVASQASKLFDQQLNIDFNKIYASKGETVSLLRGGIEASLAKVMKINEKAKLVRQDNKVIVATPSYLIEAKSIVIATGSCDQRINIEGIDLAIDSKALLDLDYLPKSINIIGGGVIGMEVASIYNALGVKVSVFEYFPTILSRFDKEIARRLANLLKAKGINIYCNASVYKLEKSDNGVKLYARIGDNEICEEAEVCLSATGRIPNVSDLGLDEVGIEYSNKGIKVNNFQQTNITNIYAIGDVCGGIMLAHKASFDGRVVLNHLLNRAEKVNFDLIPACCFTIPEVASIGLSEEEAKDKGIDYKVVKQLYRANGKAQAIKEVDGFVKLIISDDLIVGASIIGEEANLLIHEIAALMNGKIKVSEAKSFIHAHPTLSEIIQDCLNK